jgi:hypothetical protein
MTLPVEDEPGAIVNFGDAGAGAHASVSFWISRQTRDGLARWFGENLAFTRDLWSVLYYDPTVPATPPPTRTTLWYSDLGWIVGRTGYAPADLVVAMRSGGPYNHEHAYRNGLIVKCFGDRLIVDPMRPPYSFRDPSWKMRLTGGHSALLIDGKGHQYVDGHEGTNASLASATMVRRGEREGLFYWTSDATQAYQLVIPDVRSVTRTVITLADLPAVVVVDKVIKKSEPSTIQARFFAFNSDGKGVIAAAGNTFTVTRPHAGLTANAASAAGVSISTALPDIPLERARTYPFADVGTDRPSTEICLVTLLLPSPAGGPTGTGRIEQEGRVTTAHIASKGRKAQVRVIDSGAIPEFEVRTE